MYISWPTYNRKLLAIWFCIMICVGLVTSRALMSIGMICLICNVIINTDLKENAKKYVLFPPFPLVGFIANTLINFDLKEIFRKIWARKEFIAIITFFLLILISGIYSDDKAEFFRRMRIKLPFLALPLAIGCLPRFSLKDLKSILYSFILITFISALAVLMNYLIHFDQITHSFSYGKAIPVPFSHIRFSLLMAFAAYACLYFLVDQHQSLSKPEKILLSIGGIFLFAMLHIVSVRSGLLAIYVAIFYFVIKIIVVNRKWKIGVVFLLFIILAPILAYQNLPSVRKKIGYMKYDLQMYSKGTIEDYSDARRLMSMEVGLNVAKENWLFGVGVGDMIQEVQSYYGKHHPKIDKANQKLPHNQFIWTITSTGMVGLFVLLFSLLYPLFFRRNYQNALLTGFVIMILTSFLSEYTLETQLGTAFCLTMFVVILNYQKDRS